VSFKYSLLSHRLAENQFLISFSEDAKIHLLNNVSYERIDGRKMKLYPGGVYGKSEKE
jgi:hypothetical protein